MQNSKTLAQTLLGEAAHFGFCSPKIGLLRGVGGVPEIFFLLESSDFCELGAHSKFLNPTTIPSMVLSNGTNTTNNKKINYQK